MGWYLLEVDGAGEPSFYKLLAVNMHGNVSQYAFLQPVGTVGVESNPDLPTRMALHPCALNPLLDHAVVHFDLPLAAPVSLAIYDAQGQSVRQAIRAAQMRGGCHECTWNDRDDTSVRLPAGIYFPQLQTPNHSQTQKALIVE